MKTCGQEDVDKYLPSGMHEEIAALKVERMEVDDAEPTEEIISTEKYHVLESEERK